MALVGADVCADMGLVLEQDSRASYNVGNDRHSAPYRNNMDGGEEMNPETRTQLYRSLIALGVALTCAVAIAQTVILQASGPGNVQGTPTSIRGVAREDL